MKNKLIDLNNHLFLALERLGDEGLEGEALQAEVERSKAIQGLASQVVGNAKLALDSKKLQLEYGLKEMPAMLEANS